MFKAILETAYDLFGVLQELLVFYTRISYVLSLYCSESEEMILVFLRIMKGVYNIMVYIMKWPVISGNL